MAPSHRPPVVRLNLGVGQNMSKAGAPILPIMEADHPLFVKEYGLSSSLPFQGGYW